MKKIFSILTAMCLLMGMVIPATVLAADEAATAPTPWINETFDEDKFVVGANVGSSDGWWIQNASQAGGNVTTISYDPETTQGPNKVAKVELKAKEYDGNKFAAKDIKNSLTGVSYVLFEHKMWLDNNVPRAEFYVNFATANSSNNIQLTYYPNNEENRFVYNISETPWSVSFGGDLDIPYEEWVDIKLLLNVSAQTYDVYINNVKANTEACSLYRADKITTLNNVQIGVFRNHNGSGNVYYDDVVVTPLTDASAVEKEIDDARMAKMESDLTAYTLTGQKYVINDFTANLTGLVNTDTVTIESDNNAFAYNASTKAVTIIQGAEDKIANLTVTVTSAKGNTFTKNLKVYIPSVSDVKLNEGMNYSSFENATEWSLTGVSGVDKGTTYTMVTSPDDSADKVLDANIEKVISGLSSNQTARLSKEVSVSGHTIIQANFKFDDGDTKNDYLWYINGKVRNSNGELTVNGGALVQLVLNRKSGAFWVAGTKVCDGDPFPVDTWFNLKVDLNTENGTCDIYIDNAKVNNAPVKINATVNEGEKVTEITRMEFGNNRATGNPGHMYVDDIMVRVAKPAYKITGMTFANEATTPINGGKIEKISIIKNTEETVADAKAIVAVYDKTSGKLLKTSTPATVSATGDITIEMDLPAQDNLKACAFLWRMNTLVPLAEILEK